MQNPDSAVSNNHLSRRDALKLMTGVTGWALLNYFLTGCGVNLSGDPQKESLQVDPIEFGFTTHLYNNPESGNNLDLDMFKKQCDILKSNGLSWIRFNLWEWEIAKSGNNNIDIE